MRTRWERIVRISEGLHGGAEVPRRARPPWPFFNDVITSCGWGTKVAALESELLGGGARWPSGAIARVLGRQLVIAGQTKVINGPAGREQPKSRTVKNGNGKALMS